MVNKIDRSLFETRSIVRIGMYSLLIDAILVAMKFVLACMTGSLVLHADAFHSLVDFFSSIVLILGLILSGRKSKDFPYGLYKVENIVAVVISLALFFTAYEILKQTVFGVDIPTHELWVPIAAVPFGIVPYLFSIYELRAGKKFNSPSLMADASQFRMDVFSSAIVFVGLLGQSLGIPLDKIAAGIIALFVGYAAWGLMASSMRVLLDASVSRDTLEKIKMLIKEEPAVSEVENVIGRNSGRFIFVEAAVKLRVSDLAKAHLISQKIEEKIKEKVTNVDRILVRYGPQNKSIIRYAIPLVSQAGQISDDFGESPYFAFVDVDPWGAIVRKHEVAANPYLGVEGVKGVRVAEFLTSYSPDVVVTKENLLGRAPGYVFAAAGTDIAKTEAESLDEFLRQFVTQTAVNTEMRPQIQDLA